MSITGKLERTDRDHNLWPEILRLDQDFFPRPWKADDWNSLNFSQNTLWAWLREGQVVGYALFATPQDETAHLLKILVHPELQGKGIAQEFWKELVLELRNSGYKSIYLEVEESNVRAQTFYHRMSFLVLRRVKSYYSDGESAVMMQLTL